MNLTRQKTKVLQSVNSRQGPRTDQPENQESLHLNQSKASITLTGATNQSTMSSAVFRPKSAQLPQVSMSVMTDIENEPETEKGKFPKQNRTYSTAHSEASMGDDFEEKTPQQLLIHPSGPVSPTKSSIKSEGPSGDPEKRVPSSRFIFRTKSERQFDKI